MKSAPPVRAVDRTLPSARTSDGDGLGLHKIEQFLTDHSSYRESCINLIASENITSPAVTRLQSNELSHRYGDYRGIDQQARKYQGNRHIVLLEQYVTGVVKNLFGAVHADLRPLSGHVAGAAVVMALCKPGDTVLELDGIGGGHRLAEKLACASLIDLNVKPLPFDGETYNLDLARCRETIRELKPRLVILGSSSFLFPHDVAAIREIVDELPNTWILYDASHVLGLIAGGSFQKPLAEGAHIVAASTHKTFCGPQGGLVLTNHEDLASHIAEAIYPALVTNHHLHRLPALGAACLEWNEYGAAHAAAVIDNARAFAEALKSVGLDVVGNGQRHTDSHTVLISTRSRGRIGDLTRRLEEAGIIAGATVLPERWGRSGMRFGVQEMTRRGMTHADFPILVQWIGDLLSGKRTPEQCRPEIKEFARRFDQCLFALA